MTSVTRKDILEALGPVDDVVVNDIIRMGASDEELLTGVRAGGYDGRVVIGRDLERY